MTPTAALEECLQRATLLKRRHVESLPPVGEVELREVEGRRPAVPWEIRKLLARSSGLLLPPPVDELRFLGFNRGIPDELFPGGVDIAWDGSGNAWVLDTDQSTGAWGTVFFVSHDPMSLVVRAKTLTEFLPIVCLADEAKDAIASIDLLTQDPGPRAASLRTSPDALLRSLAVKLAEDAFVVDLRSPEPGQGFAWDPAHSVARRLASEGVFEVRDI